MKAADYLAALNTVEEDHELVLEKVRALKETVSALLDPRGLDAHRVLDRLRDVYQFLATKFEAHMEEEETTLFPVLEESGPEGSDLAAHLREGRHVRGCFAVDVCLGRS